MILYLLLDEMCGGNLSGGQKVLHCCSKARDCDSLVCFTVITTDISPVFQVPAKGPQQFVGFDNTQLICRDEKNNLEKLSFDISIIVFYEKDGWLVFMLRVQLEAAGMK